MSFKKYLTDVSEVDQYVKWLLGRDDVKIIFKPGKHDYYKAWAFPYSQLSKANKIESSYNMMEDKKILTKKEIGKLRKNPVDTIIFFRDRITKETIWHECGHLEDCTDENNKKMNDEARAHLWAINKAESRGYVRIVDSLMEHLDHWDDEKNNDMYHKARKIILKKCRQKGLIS